MVEEWVPSFPELPSALPISDFSAPSYHFPLAQTRSSCRLLNSRKPKLDIYLKPLVSNPALRRTRFDPITTKLSVVLPPDFPSRPSSSLCLYIPISAIRHSFFFFPALSPASPSRSTSDAAPFLFPVPFSSLSFVPLPFPLLFDSSGSLATVLSPDSSSSSSPTASVKRANRRGGRGERAFS